MAVLALVLLAGAAPSVRPAGRPATVRDPVTEIGNRRQASRGTRRSTCRPPPRSPSRHRRRWPARPPSSPTRSSATPPYWTLPQSCGFRRHRTSPPWPTSASTPTPTAPSTRAGSGWNGYESQDLVNLVNRSHAAGDRVVLTVTDFGQSSLDAITSDPDRGRPTARPLIVRGVGQEPRRRQLRLRGRGLAATSSGLTRLITQVSNALHAANPHWQVTMATYASRRRPTRRLLRHRRRWPRPSTASSSWPTT